VPLQMPLEGDGSQLANASGAEGAVPTFTSLSIMITAAAMAISLLWHSEE
jgi:hypothetical protein